VQIPGKKIFHGSEFLRICAMVRVEMVDAPANRRMGSATPMYGAKTFSSIEISQPIREDALKLRT
jgi:hypothetical protein